MVRRWWNVFIGVLEGTGASLNAPSVIRQERDHCKAANARADRWKQRYEEAHAELRRLREDTQ